MPRQPNHECECGNPRRPKAVGCDTCRDIDRQRVLAETSNHQLVMALRHLDWVQMAEIADVLDIGRENLSSRLNWLVNAGEVEQRRVQGMGWQYRVKQRRVA